MGKKWTNRNLSGALHYVTANCAKRMRVLESDRHCALFLETIKELKALRPFKLIAYVLMPDHCHFIVNPIDGKITELTGALKGISARRIIDASPSGMFRLETPSSSGATHQVWQDSFKALPLWSDWLIWQKINYIHNNPVKARLVKSAADYRWSSFRAFYLQSDEPLAVDRDWWWSDDVRKLEMSMAEWQKQVGQGDRQNRRK